MKLGVTGHQDFSSLADLRWLDEALGATIDELNVSEGVTCLARGSDQLFATTLAERSIPYVVVLACANIERTFVDRPADLATFRHLRGLATSVEVLPIEDPSDEAFLRASRHMVEISQSVLAIWDGKRARGVGGTADTVMYARELHRPVHQLNPYARERRELF